MLSKISEALLRVYARFQQEKGQALAEYGLIIALVAVVLIAGLGLLAAAILRTFTSIDLAMP
ncbi:MAG: Flp family type IVb pilin [Dehalococcoidia bacterium]|nr:Flp family type IVb pilin [Dehalococcoidia bacterium]